MTLLPKVKLKAVVNFPATVLDGTGIDVAKSNGTYQFNLDFADFAPPVTGLTDPANQNALLWNSATGHYDLIPASILTGAGVFPATALPLVDSGSGTIGASAKYAREDHVHPVGSNNFIQAGTGALTRTMQDKARERVSVADFSTATQAASAITAATSGGTIAVPNGTAATLPGSYPGINFEYFGPAVPFRLHEESGADSIATHLVRSQLPLSITGTAQFAWAIENHPVGAAVNGPAQGNYALALNTSKQNWASTTQPGEVGGLYVAVRNGGTSGGIKSDSSAILAEVVTKQAVGFSCIMEAVNYNLNAGGAALQGIDVQLGVLDPTTGASFGAALISKVGTINYGLLISAEASTTISVPILYKDSVGAKFTLDSAGVITGTDLILNSGLWTTTFVPSVSANTGTFTNATGAIRYKAFGKTVIFALEVNIVTNGTAAGFVKATLPFTAGAGNYGAAGREINVGGKMLQGAIAPAGSFISIFNYDNTYPGGNGTKLIVSGSYESA